MKILEKRPLALILCIMLGGFSFSLDFSNEIKLILAFIPLLVIGIIFIFDNLKCGRKLIVIVSLIALSVSLLLSLLWSYVFFPIRFYNENVCVEAKVYEVDNSSSSSTKIICKTNKIDGNRDRHTFILYVDKSQSAKIRRYDIITFSADVSDFPKQDDGFAGRSYYVSNGYSAILTNVSEIEILGNEVDYFDNLFKSLRLKISNKLKLRTDYETGSFLAALIVGNREDLNGNTKLNFARLGISHILALSGMHLAILSFALNSVLIRIGIKKKLRVLLMTFAVLFYIALTGFSASVLRSGFMLVITSVLFLLSRKADAITSLVLSVSIIVAINPTSALDFSLWLSAFATLGVIVFSEIGQKPDKDMSFSRKLWITFKNGCLVSVFAIASTFAFTALRFEHFSVASVFTTLIFSFVIQFFIYGGLLLLLIGGIIPFGEILIFFSNLILGLAERISSLKFVYVSMSFVVVKLLIVLLTVFFFAFLLLEIKNKKRGIVILLVLMLSTFSVAEACTLAYRYDDGITYSPSVSGDVTILKEDGEVTAIYCGKSFADFAWDILDVFSEEKLTYIDNFVFTSYSYSAVDFTNSIISGIKVEKILLPTPTTSDELSQSEGLSYLLSDYGTDMEFYELAQYITFGSYKYQLIEKVDYTYGKYPENLYEIVCGEDKWLYLSVCDYELLSPSAKAFLYNSENLIIGSIGNTNYYIFDMLLPDIKTIYYYDDGRLTDNALDYYAKKGALTRCVKTPFDISD